MNKLERIKQILTHEHTNKHGTIVTADAYYNLEGALQDIENRSIDTDIAMGITRVEDTYKIDKVCIDTIKRVQQQIADVMKVLNETEPEIASDPSNIQLHDDDWHHPKVEDKEH